MGPDTLCLRNSANMRIGLKTVLTIIAALSFSLATAHADVDIKEGYDENTEVTVRGTVTGKALAVKGPVVVLLTYAGKKYAVITAPVWFLRHERVDFREGSEIEVRGSKYIGSDGKVYVIGREVRVLPEGKTLMLRDTFCKPMWSGPRIVPRHSR